MTKFTKTFNAVWGVIDLILGILFCCTLIGAILGIPLIVASKKLRNIQNLNNEQLVNAKGTIIGWGVVNTIFITCTVIGLFFMVICLILINSHLNKLKENNFEEIEGTSFSGSIKNGAKGAVGGFKDVFGIKSKTEKQDNELQRYKTLLQNGDISQEEYDQLRKKTLGL